jgi:hypothetical protein
VIRAIGAHYENQKFDGYRIHARLDHSLRLLTRPASTGRNRRGRGVARRRTKRISTASYAGSGPTASPPSA